MLESAIMENGFENERKMDDCGEKGYEDDDVLIGPDLNITKASLDKKLYRQVILKRNGLRVLLISDVVALGQNVDTDSSDKDDFGDENDEIDDNDDDNESMSVVEEVGAGGEEKYDRQDSEEDDEGDDEEDDDEDDEEEGLRKAAAALVVGAGSYYDPPGAMGMAHFLEHMLFMGTKKYPTENAYDAYICKNGGYSNAYTELEHTVYNFEIPQEKLFAALDMFAQFFIDPLLLPDAVDREINSIESEFQLSKNIDDCRWQELMFTTSKGDRKTFEHPFGKFSWGNLHSLKEVPEQNGLDMLVELRKFYDQYYYASNMSLVVVGGYTLDELQSRVVQSFGDIPAGPRVPSPFISPIQKPKQKYARSWEDISTGSLMKNFGMPFEPSSLGRIYRIVPVKDHHTLTITWQLPPQQKNWESKPYDFIGHLLGHEGGGSILAVLKKKAWAVSCFAGVGFGGYEFASSHALFTLSFTLSEEGIKYWTDIVHLVYSYLGVVLFFCHSQGGLPSYLFEELQAICKLSYQFADEKTPDDLVEEVADNLSPDRALPPERVLDGYNLLFSFDQNLFTNLLEEYFIPSNARIDLMSSNFGRASDYQESTNAFLTQDGNSCHTGDALEFNIDKVDAPFTVPEFDAKYWCHIIPSKTIEKWQKAATPTVPSEELGLNLPVVNPFVPTVFDLKPLTPEYTNHPLLGCTLSLDQETCNVKELSVATAVKYNDSENLLLLKYEDGQERWHKVDLMLDTIDATVISPTFESSFDNKSVHFKLISLPEDSQTKIVENGHSHHDKYFPTIPPPLSESRLPQLLFNDPALKLWWLQDRKFKRPTAELRMLLLCPESNKNPLYRACSDLLVNIWQDAVTEISYQASLAELGSSISISDKGFLLRVHGFDHKLLGLAKEMLSVLLSFVGRKSTDGLPATVKAGRFDACLEVLSRRYANASMQASSLSTGIRLLCLRNTTWSIRSKMMAIKDIDVTSFITCISSIVQNMSVEALFHGNCDQSDAKAASEMITDALKLNGVLEIPKDQYPVELIVQMPPRKEIEIIYSLSKDKADSNTAVEMYFQVGPDNARERVLTDLLAHMMDEPLYNQIRTKEQFGYLVDVGSKWTNGVMGMCLKVVTAVKSPEEVIDRMEKFLIDFREDIISMKDEFFMENVRGLATNKLEMYSSLEAECSDLWSEILDCRYDWQSLRNDALLLRSVSKENVLDAYDEWLYPLCTEGEKRERRCLTVVVQGSSTSKDEVFVSADKVGETIDKRVEAFHEKIGNKTWGQIMKQI